MLDFAKHRDVFARHPDQFAGFRVFGCDCSARFDGTVFRLPLRTPDQAASSRISSRAHTPLEIRALLQEFAREAAQVLLFLKHVESIAIMEWLPGGSEPTLHFQTRITDPTPALRAQRAFMMAAAGPALTAAPAAVDFALSVSTRATAAGMEALPPVPPPAAAAAGAPSSSEHNETWLICNQLGGGRSQELACRRETERLRLVPWAGVAGRVSESGGISWPRAALPVALTAGDGAAIAGAAYCFLPLPIKTGLPVHVNGFFEISSNRRDRAWEALAL